jgi:hypothetical protein
MGEPRGFYRDTLGLTGSVVPQRKRDDPCFDAAKHSRILDARRDGAEKRSKIDAVLAQGRRRSNREFDVNRALRPTSHR